MHNFSKKKKFPRTRWKVIFNANNTHEALNKKKKLYFTFYRVLLLWFVSETMFTPLRNWYLAFPVNMTDHNEIDKKNSKPNTFPVLDINEVTPTRTTAPCVQYSCKNTIVFAIKKKKSIYKCVCVKEIIPWCLVKGSSYLFFLLMHCLTLHKNPSETP